MKTDLRAQIGTVVDGGRLGLLTRGFLVNATTPKSLVWQQTIPTGCR